MSLKAAGRTSPTLWKPDLPVLILCGEILLALGFGFLLLGSKSFWVDEIFSLAIAKDSWSQEVRVISNSEPNMALYYVVLKVWLQPGESEVWVRTLSVLFAVAAIPVFWRVVVELFDSRLANLAALLMIVNGFWVAYAQEARAYSLSIFLISLASLIFLRAIRTNRPLWWVMYSIVVALAVYSHMLNGLIVVPHLISMFLLPQFRSLLRPAACSVAAIGVLVLPLAVFSAMHSGQLDTAPRPSPRQVVQVFYALAGGHVSLLDSIPGATALTLVVYLALSLCALRAFLTPPIRVSSEKWPEFFVLAWLLIPIGLAIVMSLYEAVLVPRYLVVSFPALVLWISLGLRSISSKQLAQLSLAVVLLVSLAGVASYYTSTKEDWRGAGDYIYQESDEGDAILFYIPATEVALDYMAHDHKNAKLPHLETYADSFATSGTATDALHFGFNEQPTVAIDLADRLAQKYDRVWLVLAQTDDSGEVSGKAQRAREIEVELRHRYSLGDSRVFRGNIRVVLYTRSTTPYGSQ